jgi:NitT/TauT family transport system substrate-binding protein
MKKILIIGLILLIIFSTAGCESKDSVEELKFGVMSDVGAVPFLIAEKEGYYEEAGVNVDITVFRSALDRDTALQTGNLDGAMADMLTILFYKESGMEFTMTSSTYGNYRLISSPGLTKEKFVELDNPQIGISSNTVIDFSTDLVVSNLNIADKVEKVAIPQMPVRLEMLYENSLDGSTLPEPLAYTAQFQGGELIGDTESLNLFPGVVIFNSNLMEENSKEVESFYDGYNKAVEYVNNTDKDEFYHYLIEELGFSEEIKDSFELPEFTKKEAPDENTYNVVSDWMIEKELINKNYTYSEVYSDY